VTVSEGDTLWSIASHIAPQRDPRTVVATLERINHLTDPLLQPGQVLRTR
jgi:LysM repeat protein